MAALKNRSAVCDGGGEDGDGDGGGGEGDEGGGGGGGGAVTLMVTEFGLMFVVERKTLVRN